jgi:ACDE family multidrug resistance protein
MSIAPVERSVASATYGFVRLIGGGLAPFAAGKLVEHFNPDVPFLIGAATVALGAAVLTTVHTPLTTADAGVVALPANSDLGPPRWPNRSLWPPVSAAPTEPHRGLGILPAACDEQARTVYRLG